LQKVKKYLRHEKENIFSLKIIKVGKVGKIETEIFVILRL
jgi:hypothetical protein